MDIKAARWPFLEEFGLCIQLKNGKLMGQKQKSEGFEVNFTPFVVKSGSAHLTSRHVSGAGKENTDQGL